jgi:pimeloyl-ACP methyl ester carboxylesterase
MTHLTHTELIRPDQARLAVQIQGRGPALFLISGLGGTASFWDAVLESLTGHFTLITLDQRGIGSSSRGSAPCTIDLLADDCLAVMDDLGLTHAAVLGHSTGGCIAQTMALKAPARISALLLSGTWAKADRYMHELFAMRAALLHADPVQYANSATFLSYNPAWLNEHWGVFDKAVATAPTQAASKAIIAERINALIAFDQTAQLQNIKAPTLVLGSADDLIVPLYLQRDLASRIALASQYTFPYGGHFFPITQTLDFCQQIHRWLADNATTTQRLRND